jgi:hypothetical protein
MLFDISGDFTISMIRKDKTGHIRPVKVKGNSIQWRDIWVVHDGQDPNFSDESLIDDSRYVSHPI